MTNDDVLTRLRTTEEGMEWNVNMMNIMNSPHVWANQIPNTIDNLLDPHLHIAVSITHFFLGVTKSEKNEPTKSSKR